MREEVLPKNILMIGPTGVGKTEIARRLAKLANAPFIKVEATKFTEVGYVGRDVEQIVRDLVEAAIHIVREDLRKSVEAEGRSDSRGTGDRRPGRRESQRRHDASPSARNCARASWTTVKSRSTSPTRAAWGLPTLDVPGMPGAQIGMINLNDMLGKALGGQRTKRVRA